mmetsp:Transcript_42219/g.99103  ORF Transcript_42219/g.99103 Transcript_42219/m.99103 type:complete len:400 (+) Transcript_42219:108-1307(+)
MQAVPLHHQAPRQLGSSASTQLRGAQSAQATQNVLTEPGFSAPCRAAATLVGTGLAAVAMRSSKRGQRRMAAAAATATVTEATASPAWKGNVPSQSSLPRNADGTIDYTSIDRSPVSQVLMNTTRQQLAKEAGRDSSTAGYGGLIELAREVNDAEGTAEEVQRRARNVFEGLLPALYLGWIPGLWRSLVQPNVQPWVANTAFFYVFYLLFPWLMGPMEGDDYMDVEVPQNWRNVLPFLPQTIRVPQSVKAERCRFLENSQCASVCVNTCKVPSQEWLRDDFGMEIHIQPNYDDFSCRWKFGVKAPPLAEDEAVMVPCFTKCPSTIRGTKDALSLREKILREEEDRRLAAAVAELTPGGTANSVDSLEERRGKVGASGKCWSVAEDRPDARAKVLTSSSS